MSNISVKNIVYKSDCFKLMSQLGIGKKAMEAQERGESCQGVFDSVADVLLSRYSKEEVKVLDHVLLDKIRNFALICRMRNAKNPLSSDKEKLYDWSCLAVLNGIKQLDFLRMTGIVIPGLYDMFCDMLIRVCDEASDVKPVVAECKPVREDKTSDVVTVKKRGRKSNKAVKLPDVDHTSVPVRRTSNRYNANIYKPGEIRDKLKDEGLFDFIPWFLLAKPYFGKSNGWLCRKLRGVSDKGLPTVFSADELFKYRD